MHGKAKNQSVTNIMHMKHTGNVVQQNASELNYNFRYNASSCMGAPPPPQ